MCRHICRHCPNNLLYTWFIWNPGGLIQSAGATIWKCLEFKIKLINHPEAGGSIINILQRQLNIENIIILPNNRETFIYGINKYLHIFICSASLFMTCCLIPVDTYTFLHVEPAAWILFTGRSRNCCLRYTKRRKYLHFYSYLVSTSRSNGNSY